MSGTKRILLVEDSENDAQLALAAFEEVNLAGEVTIARDGEEALDFLLRRGPYAHLEGGRPAVVVLDLKLPKVDGLEVLATLKSSEELKAIPIVMLTSSQEASDVARSYGLGVNAYVVKPLSFPDFVTAVKELGVFWALVNQAPAGCVEKPVG